jgi:hypothetical protein
MKIKRFNSIIAILFCTHFLYAQSTISGVIKDEESQLNIPNTSIQLGKRGIITDNQGKFQLTVRETDWEQNLNLKISSVGYHSIHIPIKSFKNESTILLKPQSKSLQNVIVNSSARDLVKQAIEAIPKNYPQRKFILIGNSIETNCRTKIDTVYQLAFRTKTLLSYHEGENKSSQVQLIHYSKKGKPIPDSTKYIHWKNDGKVVELFDLVHSQQYFLDPRKLKDYSYELIDLVSINNRETYKIKFLLKAKPENYEGLIFIDEESFAIVGFEFNVASFIFKNNPEKKEETSLSEGKVTYKKVDNFWILNQVEYSKYAKIRSIPGYAKLSYQTIDLDTINNTLFLNYKNRLTRDIMMERLDSEFGVPRIDSLIIGLENKNSTLIPHSALKRKFYSTGKFKLGISLPFFTPNLKDEQIAWQNYLGSKRYETSIFTTPILQYGISMETKYLGFSISKSIGIPFWGNSYGGNSMSIFKSFQFNRKGRSLYLKPSIGRDKIISYSKLESFTPNQNLQEKENLQNEFYDAKHLNTLYGYHLGMALGIHLTRSKQIEIGFKYHMINHWEEELHLIKSTNHFFQNLFNLNAKTIQLPFSTIYNVPNQINYSLSYQF